MKRRSAAAALEGKWRRPIKRSQKAENAYGSLIVYVKLIVLWILVLLSDYFVEFRFEYLWPFWLFLRSVYDSFKYQGLAFSVFFVCIAVTSDMICYLFIPVHWLFFAASTYVWVQYVWHTEKGVCAQTVCLWLLFVYIEAAIRLREFKAHVDIRQLPLHLDLCRPFAAHCIGYPVVTLGFGFKSYIGYRMKQRKQKEVQKDNEYYFEFLREALPPGQAREEAFNFHPSPKSCPEDRTPDGSSVIASNGGSGLVWSDHGCRRENGEAHHDLSSKSPRGGGGGKMSNGAAAGSSSAAELEYMEKELPEEKKSSSKGSSSSAPSAKESRKSKEAAKLTKEEMAAKLEQDIKRLKTELQQSRNKENDLRDQIISYMSGERHLKSEISNLQVEKSLLESRVSGLLSTRAGEKAALSTLEKKLADERKQKTEFQIKLETERKTKKEAANAERSAQQSQARGEVLRLEAEVKSLRSELSAARERAQAAEQEVFVLRKYKETHGDPEELIQALKAMQEKNTQIEKSLSSETKLKMDLFSALGDAKRELGIKQGVLVKKDKEISELKAKIAEVLAVMPHSNLGSAASSPEPSLSGAAAAAAAIFAPASTLALALPVATSLGGLAEFEHHDYYNSAFGAGAAAKTNGKANDV